VELDMGLEELIQGILDAAPDGTIEQLTEGSYEEIATYLVERIRTMSTAEYTAFSAKLMAFTNRNPQSGLAVDDVFRALWRLKMYKQQHPPTR
jgi:hypothetical protein